MAKTILTNSRGNGAGSTGILAGGTTSYYRVGNASLVFDTVQNREEITWHTPGVFSKLYVRVLTNSTTGDTTIHLRVGTSNVTNTVTIGAGATGVFEDTTHTDTIADGNKVVYRIVTGATGSITIALISIIFDSTTDCVSKQTNHGYSPAAASAIQYSNISGRQTGSTIAEVNAESTIKLPGIAKNAFFFVSVNARTTATTFTLRKNRTDTALVITVGAGATGIFEDTTTSISYTTDDEIDWKIVTGAGTETLTFFSLSIDYITTSGQGFINASSVGASGDITLGPSVTEYYVVGGAMTEAVTTEADALITARQTFTLSNLTVNAKTNTLTSTSTVTLMKNGSPTAMTVSIGSGVSGFISDTTHTVDYAPGDIMSYKVITGGTGTTLTISQMAVWTLPLIAVTGSAGRSRQGRSPLYRTVKPRVVAVIIRLKVQLEYEVIRLTITVAIPYAFEKVTLIKYASAVIEPLVNVLPLRRRPTPKPVVRTIITQLPYEVQTLRLKSACAYEVDKLITRKKHLEILKIAMNYLMSDFTSYTNR